MNKKSKKGPTDRLTDQRTDKAGYRVACTRLKTTIYAVIEIVNLIDN